MIEAVIFDWGGTLSVYVDIDMEDMWRMAAQHLAAGSDHRREDEIRNRLVDVEAEAWAGIPLDQRSFTLAQLLAKASEALHLDVAAAVIEEATQGHLDAWTPHIRHDPAAGAVLAALKERGLKVGLLSNTHWPREFHEHFLARDGLVDYIDARLYTSELTYSKPHASAFRAALDAVGVADPSRAVMVGDRAYDDVFGAQQAGLRGVLRPHGGVPGYDVEPDAVIGPLPELLDVLDRWQ
ncbi:MAG: HAD family hydrolase [Actinomycetota bacterium]|nr:HAD family hydrolase [Actinomycetota bacterium]MDQ6949155.1 HAD family hydrolase [Actinomycetota bacterium]